MVDEEYHTLFIFIHLPFPPLASYVTIKMFKRTLNLNLVQFYPVPVTCILTKKKNHESQSGPPCYAKPINV